MSMKIKNAYEVTKDIFIQGTNNRRFKIISLLGEGGYCNVFKAHDNKTDRDVALKIHGLGSSKDQFDDGFHKVFEKEVSFLRESKHPNIITLYDYYIKPHMLVLELAEGSLEDCMYEIKDFSDSLNVIEQIAPALDAIHLAGLTHRDVKLKNILKVGELYKLSDFGSAGPSGNSSSNHGTDGFRAPEGYGYFRIDNKPYFEPATDVFSLAILEYILLKKISPYPNTITNEKTDPDFLPKIFSRELNNKKLTDILIKATDFNMQRRFQSAPEFYEALKSINTNFTINIDYKVQLSELYKTLDVSLRQTRHRLKVTKPKVIEDQYNAYNNLVTYVNNFGFSEDPEFKKISKRYMDEITKDEEAILSWIDAITSSGKTYKDFAEEHEFITAIIHLRYLNPENHNRRLGYKEYIGNDGVEGKGNVWVEHYHRNNLEGGF